MTTEKTIHPVDVIIAKNIKRLRNACGLTQAQFAARMIISKQQIFKYETNRNRLAASLLHDMAVVLNQPVSAFYEDTDLKTRVPENTELRHNELEHVLARLDNLVKLSKQYSLNRTLSVLEQEIYNIRRENKLDEDL